MKYDDASWHYGGDFPKDLPEEAGATHTGMFVAWALLAGLAGEIHTTESPEDLRDLQSRTVTPGHFFMTRRLDTPDRFLADYEKTLAKTEPSLYHIEDSWANFDLLKPVFDERFAAWRARKNAQ